MGSYKNDYKVVIRVALWVVSRDCYKRYKVVIKVVVWMVLRGSNKSIYQEVKSVFMGDYKG